MKQESFFFLCGEQAVKIYHNVSIIEEMTDYQHGVLVDYGILNSIHLDENTTPADLIDQVIEIHEGSLNITLITEHEYNYLTSNGVK